jgi:hypothetical protein
VSLLIACERAPESGHDIPSQPIISRIENLADARTLYKIGTGFIDLFCRRNGTGYNCARHRRHKTACSRWQANQFRLFLHTGAYWLLHSLRMAAPKKSRWRRATFETIRTTFVKIGCRVEELKRQVKLVFPRHVPHAAALALITHRLTAQGP